MTTLICSVDFGEEIKVKWHCTWTDDGQKTTTLIDAVNKPKGF